MWWHLRVLAHAVLVSTRELIVELALQVEVEGGHRADLHADVGTLDVNLDEFDPPALVLLGQLLVLWRDHNAGAAGLRVEVDDNRWVVREDLLEGALVTHLFDRSCRQLQQQRELQQQRDHRGTHGDSRE